MSEIKQNFFLIVPPGFEGIATDELRAWLPGVEISEQSRGGIAFSAGLNEALELNRVLKVPTRLLVRLADFGCSDFPKLFRKIKGFPWVEWLPKNTKVRVEASTHQSRLKIKKRIEMTTLEALSTQGFIPSEDDDAFAIYIRFVDDVCFVSLDTSGEILHKRGYREFTPDAPIRENLAAAILLTAKHCFESQSEFADLEPLIIDPMAGSGTFLIEAINLLQKNDRAYAFEKFVSYKATGKKIAEKYWTKKIFGIEADTKSIVAVKNAFKESKIKSESNVFLADVFQTPTKVLEDKLFEIRSEKAKILVCNPPYGKRLKIEEPFSVYYPRLLNKFEELFSPAIASVILPQKVNLERLKIPAAWQILRTDQFSNGGFSVVLVTFKRVSD